MENQVPRENLPPEAMPPGAGERRERKRFWAIFALFFVVLVLVGLYLSWQWYLSPAAVQRVQLEENLALYNTAMQNYESAMRADTYGSSTPEGTLQMFIAALKQGDVELASKYFLLDDTGSRVKWEEGLMQARDNNRIHIIIVAVESALPHKNQTSSSTVVFETLDSKGIVDVLVESQLNRYSGVWKIESM